MQCCALAAGGAYSCPCRAVFVPACQTLFALAISNHYVCLSLLQYHGGDCRYNIDGCLMTTEPYGVMECEAKCDAAKGCTSKTRRAQHTAACKV